MPRRRTHTAAPRTTDAHIVVTDATGAVSLLLRAQTPVGVAPITGLGQVVTTGDTAERADQRTPQVIWTNQQGGGSQYWYTETEGIESFTDTECDPRYPGLVTLPPGGAQLGTTITSARYGAATLSTSDTIARIEPTAFSAYPYILYVPRADFNLLAYSTATSDWVIVTYGAGFSATRIGQTCWFRGYLVIASEYQLYYTTTGSSLSASLLGTLKACCTHDNKVYVFNATTGTLQWHTDPTAGSGWTSSSVLYLEPNEDVRELREWRDASGRTVIYVTTTRRILWYDEDADVFHNFDEYGSPFETVIPASHVSRRDGNLYVALSATTGDDLADTVMWYSGTTNLTGPNRMGGLPSASRSRIQGLAGGRYWIYAFGQPTYAATSNGAVWWLNDQQAMGALIRANSGAVIWGGGYVRGQLLVAHRNGATIDAYRYTVPDSPTLPLFATDRTYPTGSTKYHEYSFTDLGTPNMDKQALWVTVKSLDHTSANKVPGLATGCTITVDIRRDTDTSWTNLGTLTSASTFPNVLPINSGAGMKGKQFKVRIGLASATSTNSPMVTSVALALLRQETPRYAYTCVVDLSKGDHDLYRGQDRAALRARMRTWATPGNLVRLDFAGGDYATQPATATTVNNCVVQFSGQESPEDGPMQYSIVFSDYSYPTSG